MSQPPCPEAQADAPHILIVDDDDRIRDLLRRFLGQNGYRASTAAGAREAREMMTGMAFDLLIVDVMMPGESGFDLTRAIRARSNVPIIVLTARGAPTDRIEGLERGADDYLSKPFEPRELALRIGSLLRRAHGDTERRAPLAFGACRFDPARGELTREGERVRLTSGELAILRALAEKPRGAVSRSALAARSNASQERAVDVQITRLRRKIESDPRAPACLHTVRGVGYALMTD